MSNLIKMFLENDGLETKVSEQLEVLQENEMLDEAIKEVISYEINESSTSAEEKLAQLQEVDSASITDEQRMKFMENYIGPMIRLNKIYNNPAILESAGVDKKPSVFEIAEMVVSDSTLRGMLKEEDASPAAKESLFKRARGAAARGASAAWQKTKAGASAVGGAVKSGASKVASGAKNVGAYAKANPGKAAAWATGAVLAATAATLAYKRFISKCGKFKGDEKKQCLVDAAKAGLSAAKAKMSSCSSSSNPDKCKAKMAKVVAKWEAKVSAASSK